MSFEDWINEAENELTSAVNANVHNRDIWPDGSQRNTHKAFLFPHYLSYKVVEENKKLVLQTKRLVFATWAVAIATILMNLFLR